MTTETEQRAIMIATATATNAALTKTIAELNEIVRLRELAGDRDAAYVVRTRGVSASAAAVLATAAADLATAVAYTPP